MLSPLNAPPASAQKIPTRSILLLAAAGFAAQAQVRVTDSLLPQIANDFQTTVGVAAIVVTAYAITHGTIQFVVGPVADRFGKYRTVAIISVLAAVLVAVCGTASTLPQLALARLATGAVVGWVIPVSMAYLGDVTPADRLQPLLARYASGYIFGQLFGQAAGGVLGDLFGWRNVFFALAAMFALAAVGLVAELIINPQTRASGKSVETSRSFIGNYAAVLSNPFARIIIAVGFIEGGLAWGAFAYIGASLHLRFGLSYTLIGITVAFFGIGGLIYSGLVRHVCEPARADRAADRRRPRHQRRLLVLAFQSVWWLAPIAVDRDRTRLLHVPQHLADHRHADDAASPRHRRLDLLVRALPRADGGRRDRRARHRSRRRGAGLSRHRGRVSGACCLVRVRVTPPAGALSFSWPSFEARAKARAPQDEVADIAVTP